MITLEKDFTGKICENCHLLQPIAYKTLAKDGNIVIYVYCANHDICYNALQQAASLRLKEERDKIDE